jgi:hypothetical protein
MSLPVDEFLRRFLLHLLPRGFVRIRNFGFLANRQRARLLPLSASVCLTVHPIYQRRLLKLLHPDASEMPHCGGTMQLIERITPAQLLARSPPCAQERAA